jgi:hypothetical protein
MASSESGGFDSSLLGNHGYPPLAFLPNLKLGSDILIAGPIHLCLCDPVSGALAQMPCNLDLTVIPLLGEGRAQPKQAQEAI